MGIQRLVESYSFDADVYNKIVSSHKITESEMVNLKGQKLSESVQKLIEDSTILSGKTVWKFPVARYDNVNLNNRKYEKRLWDRVIKEQKEVYQGGAGLKKHPKDGEDGEIEEQAVVWLNMGLNESEKIVWAEGVFVGDIGKHIEEILECGGRPGFSSSGFGELDESDNSTVRWDSYMLERVADVVLNPSQKVYGDNTMKVQRNSTMKQTDSIQESEMDNKEKCEVCNCSKDECKCEKKDIKQENTMVQETVKMSTRDLRKFKEDVIEWMSSVPEDLQEKLKELEEICSYFSPGVHPDLLAEVNKQINDTRKAIDDAVKEHSKITDTFGANTVTELKEGVKNLAIDMRLYERDAKDWKEIAEGLQEKNKMLMSVIATRPTTEIYKEMLVQMKTLKEEHNVKESNFNEYVKSLKIKIVEHQKFEENIMVELETVNKENSKLKEYTAQLKEYGNKMREKVIQFKTEMKEYQESIEDSKFEESRLQFRPENKNTYYGFNESREVESYYEDLEKRYGKDIVDYKESILNCKTLKEAMLIFNRAFSLLGSNKTRKVNEALDMEERKKLIESTSGIKIRSHNNLNSRLPSTWE